MELFDQPQNNQCVTIIVFRALSWFRIDRRPTFRRPPRGLTMTISFEIPPQIAHELRADGADLGREAKEAFLVELYRRDRIAHHQLAEALGLDRYDTDGVLKRHKVSPGVSAEESRAQAATLRDANAR